VLAAQIPGVAPKVARRQAMALLATMAGTVVLARIAGEGDFSDEILAAGREASLGSGQKKKPANARARPTEPRKPSGKMGSARR